MQKNKGNFKKQIFQRAKYLFCLLAFAFTFFHPSNLTARGNFIFGGTFGSYTVSAPNLDYGVLGTVTATVDAPHGQTLSISPEAHAAYGAHLGYLFANTNNYLMLNYSHFNNQDFNSAEAGLTEVIFITLLPADFFEDHAELARASFRYKQDFYDLTFGHNVITQIGTFNFYAGINWSNLFNNFHAEYNGIDINATETAFVDENTQFRGFGPEGGIQYLRPLFAGIMLVGETKARFPVGTVKYHYRSRGEDANDVVNIADNNAVDNAVPVLSANIALSRGFKILSRHESLVITIGYQATWVFDINRSTAHFDFNTPTESSSIEGFGNQGPYFEISVII